MPKSWESVDPQLLALIARRGVFTPALVSLWFLIQLWREAQLYGWTGSLFCGWFTLAAAAQFLAPNTTVWLSGLLAQVALAIILVLKKQLNEPT